MFFFCYLISLFHHSENSAMNIPKQNSTSSNTSKQNNEDDQYWIRWILEVSRQLLLALIYLEDKGFIYGNICAKNILLFNNDSNSNHPAVKLSDPGIRFYYRESPESPEKNIYSTLPLPWRAYELTYGHGPSLENVGVGNAHEKWSFATTMIELSYWCFIELWPDSGLQLRNNIILYNRYISKNILDIPKWLKDINTNLATLIKKCWHLLPRQRPTFMELLREIDKAINSDSIRSINQLSSINPALYKLSLNINENMTNVETFDDHKMRVIRKIGQGHFGLVQLCRYEPLVRNFGAIYAVKSIRDKMVSNPQIISDFENEFQTMKHLDHRNIVKLKGVTLPSKRLVMEYLPEGSLVNYLHSFKEKRSSMANIYNDLIIFAKEICEGMIYLQSKKVIHRDLAARNIMVAQDRLDTSYYIKISDFGLSRVIAQSNKDYYRGNPDEFPVQWYAPECIRDHTFTYVSDVWSFGVVLWEMFTLGEKPIYPDCMKNGKLSILHLFEFLQKGKRLKKPTHITADVLHLMKSAWTFDAQKRPNFEFLRSKFMLLLSKIN